MEIVRLPERPKQSEDDHWKRSLALQLATQLPEKPADALRVVELLRELVTSFLIHE